MESKQETESIVKNSAPQKNFSEKNSPREEGLGGKNHLNRKISLSAKIAIISTTLLLLVFIVVFLFSLARHQASPPSIISQSTLEEIIKIRELSTFEAVYNGIAQVANPKDPEKIDYYVSYNSKIKVGMNLDFVNIDVDHTDKVIRITLPEVAITDINVDIASLDYIFLNKKCNTSTVSQQAYKTCIRDVEQECKDEAYIYVLAQQNAENIVTALVSPFIQQLDSEYTLCIDWRTAA